MKMEDADSCGMLVLMYQTSRHDIQEDLSYFNSRLLDQLQASNLCLHFSKYRKVRWALVKAREYEWQTSS